MHYVNLCLEKDRIPNHSTLSHFPMCIRWSPYPTIRNSHEYNLPNSAIHYKYHKVRICCLVYFPHFLKLCILLLVSPIGVHNYETLIFLLESLYPFSCNFDRICFFIASKERNVGLSGILLELIKGTSPKCITYTRVGSYLFFT